MHTEYMNFHINLQYAAISLPLKTTQISSRVFLVHGCAKFLCKFSPIHLNNVASILCLSVK